MASYERCIQEITQAVGRTLTEEEGRRLDKQVSKLIDKLNIEKHAEAFDSLLMKEIEKAGDSTHADALIAKRNAVKNKVAAIRKIDHMLENWSDDPAEGLRSMLGGSMTGRKGGKHSTARSQDALSDTYIMGVAADLDKAGLTDWIAKGTFDREIWNGMWELNRATPDQTKLSVLPKEAVRSAEILNKWNELARIQANKAGAYIRKLTGYVTRHIHDQMRIKEAGESVWINDMVKMLDWERTMPDVPEDRRVPVLKLLYADFSTGRHLKLSDAPAFGGAPGTGKGLSHERTLHFRSADDEFFYNQKYGHGNLREAMFSSLARMGRDTALMREWGPSARSTYDTVVMELLNRLRTSGDHVRRESLQKAKDKLDRIVWPLLDGEIFRVESATLARYSANVRGIEMMADLGGATLSSITDIPVYATATRQQGVRMLAGIGEALKSLTQNVSSGERLHVIAETGIILDAVRNAVSERVDPSGGQTGTIARMTNAYFKFNLLRPWTDRLRGGFVLATAHRLANHAALQFDGLPQGMQHLLRQYGIDANEWSVIRQAKESHADGKAFLTPEGLSGLPPETFKSAVSGKGGAITGFTTAKGSTYAIDGSGRTTRNKAARIEHPGDSGAKPKSETTFYIKQEDTGKLGEFQAQGTGKKKIVAVGNQSYGVQYLEGPSKGKVEKRTVVIVSNEPGKGLVPVELWNKGEAVHFGNVITDITDYSYAELENFREELKDKLRNFFHDQASTAVVVPDTLTKASMLQGSLRGTAEGEARRHFWMYKSFTMGIMRQVMGRELFGYGDTRGGIMPAILSMVKDPTGKPFVGMANLIAFTTIFGYAAMAIKDMAKGRDPRVPDTPGEYAKVLAASMVQGGGLGLYGDFLFGEMKSRFGQGPLESFLGPTWRRMEDVVTLTQSLKEGQDVTGRAITKLFNSVPFANLFYTRWAMDYLVLYRLQEMSNPGFLRRMEQRVRKERNQEFILPPSEVIPHGG